MEQNQFTVCHCRATKACADFLLPEARWAIFGPAFSEVVTRVNSIARRTEELRPVTGQRQCHRKQKKSEKEECFVAGSQFHRRNSIATSATSKTTATSHQNQ